MIGQGRAFASPTATRNLSAKMKVACRIENYDPYLSDASRRRQPSAIRKLQPLVAQEGMVSLGGGMPNPTLFPFQLLRFSVKDSVVGGSGVDSGVSELELTAEELRRALQYSPTPGIPGLVKQLRQMQEREHGCNPTEYGVSVTVGSQDGLTKAFEMLLDPQKDELFLESPTYSGALAFLRPFGVKLTPVGTDEHGLRPDSLEEALEASTKSPRTKDQRRVLYVIPTAQNPSGSTLTNDRREEIYRLAQKHDMIILEDDPYYYLHLDRKSMKSFLSLDTDGRVLRFDSFSKVISSGIRIGFVTAPTNLVERLNFHVQATNLHNSGVSQMMTEKLLEHWGTEGFDRHARAVAEFYVQRRDVLLAAADRHLRGLAEWKAPVAGMFLWIKLLGIDDTKAVIEEKAAKANVLFVPGQAFDPMDGPSSYIRASYSTASDDDMDVAMHRLAELIKGEKAH